MILIYSAFWHRETNGKKNVEFSLGIYCLPG